MNDEYLHLVRSIVVDVECFNCKGKCRLPGGQLEYGELVPCPVCRGQGINAQTITIDQLRKLLATDDGGRT